MSEPRPFLDKIGESHIVVQIKSNQIKIFILQAAMRFIHYTSNNKTVSITGK
jgi:hypothetical protein